jgi:hypothetical protein
MTTLLQVSELWASIGYWCQKLTTMQEPTAAAIEDVCTTFPLTAAVKHYQSVGKAHVSAEGIAILQQASNALARLIGPGQIARK